MKSIAQIKIDVRNSGWPWPITHPNDERALYEGCRPDIGAAMEIHKFYRKLLKIPREKRRRINGVTQPALKPFALLGWWFRDVLAPLYGWKRADGSRRFDKGFISTGKKSAKSSVLCGLPLYAITAEGTQQAEAYTTAVDRNQAGIVYGKASWSARHSGLAKVVKCVDSQKRIVHQNSGSVFRVLSPDKDSAQGYNPNLLIADELHAWRDREFFESIMYGDISRENALFLMITTAGDDETSVGFEEYEFAKDLLDPENNFYSQNHFAFIAEAAPGVKTSEIDDSDPAMWKQANPSLACGAIGSLEKLEGKYREVKQTPRKRRAWMRYILNRWVTTVEDPWLDPDHWAECCQPIKDHAGKPVWCGLDLARTQDLAALAMAWWDGDTLEMAWRMWTPEATVREHEQEWRVPLRDWINEGWITATPGNDIDYADIRRAISGVEIGPEGGVLSTRWAGAVAEEYDLRDLRCDPYNGKELYEAQLEKADGVTVTLHRQGYLSMNDPCKAFEKLVNSHRLRNGNNPVINWMAAHCVAPPDASDNIKLDKKKSRHKIDGLVAAVMACGGAVANESTYIDASSGGGWVGDTL